MSKFAAMRRHPRTALGCAAWLLAGCASVAPREREQVADWQGTAALPPAVAAAIVGGALRNHLPFADAVPQARGIVATPLGDSHWRLQWQRHGRGVRVVGSHRVGIQASHAGGATAVVEPAASPDSEPGSGSWFVLDVVGDGNGSALSGALPSGWLPPIERALRLADDPQLAVPGLREPNLAAWAWQRLHATARTASGSGDEARAAALRSAAARLPFAPAAHPDAGAGDAARAHDLAWHALLAATDPLQRAACQLRLERADDALAAAEREQWFVAGVQPARARVRTKPPAAPTR